MTGSYVGPPSRLLDKVHTCEYKRKVNMHKRLLNAKHQLGEVNLPHFGGESTFLEGETQSSVLSSLELS